MTPPVSESISPTSKMHGVGRAEERDARTAQLPEFKARKPASIRDDSAMGTLSDNDVIVVIFSKEQVRHCKLAHFLKQFGKDALPQGPALAELMGRFQFLVHGYDNDPQELYAISEVRKFYQYFHRVWPYWFYFCDLQAETLTMMTLCLLPNISGFKRLGEPMAKVEYNPLDLLRFIEKNFVPLNTMMERAGMSEMDIYNRTRDVFHHFHLPYDSEPPEE